MKDFELQMRLRNNRIKAKRLELGLTPQQLADKCGVAYPLLLDYEGLRQTPLTKRGPDQWRPSARKLAAFFGCSCEDLWPAPVLAVQKPVVTIEVGAPQLAMLAGYEEERLALPSPDHRIETQQTLSRVAQLFCDLPDREANILCRRFGLGGAKEQTLDETGRVWGISKERTRRLEMEALGKLRHQLDETRRTEQREANLSRPPSRAR